MIDIRLDRRAFLLASSALVAWPGAALAKSGRKSTEFRAIAARCAGSEAWRDLTARAVLPRFDRAVAFASGLQDLTAERVRGCAALTVLGGSIAHESGISRIIVEVDFSLPSDSGAPRRFTAMVLKNGGQASPSVRCAVPTAALGGSGVKLVLTAIMEKTGLTANHTVTLGNCRGVHAVALVRSGIIRGTVRSDDLGLASDWPACVILSLAAADEIAAGKENPHVGR